MNKGFLTSILGISILLVGCSHLENITPYSIWHGNETLYLQAKSVPPVVTPKNWKGTNPSDQYRVPNLIAPQGKVGDVNLLPPGSLAAAIESGAVDKSVLKQNPHKIKVDSKALPGTNE